MPTLTAAAGSYTLTGNDANLQVGLDLMEGQYILLRGKYVTSISFTGRYVSTGYYARLRGKYVTSISFTGRYINSQQLGNR
jgi:hypothetical protein